MCAGFQHGRFRQSRWVCGLDLATGDPGVKPEALVTRGCQVLMTRLCYVELEGQEEAVVVDGPAHDRVVPLARAQEAEALHPRNVLGLVSGEPGQDWD